MSVCPGCGRCGQCGQPAPFAPMKVYPRPYVYPNAVPQYPTYPAGPYWSTIGGAVQVTC